MENKENNNTFKKSVLLLSVALIIAIVAVIILGVAVVKNTSNDRKLSERVKEVELRSAENAKDIFGADSPYLRAVASPFDLK